MARRATGRRGGIRNRRSTAKSKAASRRNLEIARKQRNARIGSVLGGHKGGLHRALGVPAGKKLPKGKLRTLARGKWPSGTRKVNKPPSWLVAKASMAFRMRFKAAA